MVNPFSMTLFFLLSAQGGSNIFFYVTYKGLMILNIMITMIWPCHK